MKPLMGPEMHDVYAVALRVNDVVAMLQRCEAVPVIGCDAYDVRVPLQQWRKVCADVRTRGKGATGQFEVAGVNVDDVPAMIRRGWWENSRDRFQLLEVFGVLTFILRTTEVQAALAKQFVMIPNDKEDAPAVGAGAVER